MSDRIGRRKRKAVSDRAHGYCEYCRSPESFSSWFFSVDHIVPISKGGTSDLNNLALCCLGCNNTKYNRIDGEDPLTGVLVTLFNPRSQRWAEHFRWSEDSSKMVGLTAIGRATISVLGLNRDCLVRSRRALTDVGKHPPREEES